MTDGDTIEVTLSGGRNVVRLAGVNAPESDECHFIESRDYLTDQILGRRVAMETVGIDRFDRTLAFVSIAETQINAELVALGHAIALTPEQGDRPGEDLLTLEEQARETDLGLWADGVCGASGPIPEVRITAVDPNPEGPDEQELAKELVVISNETDMEVEIGNWVLRDESSLHRHRFPPGTRLPAGASLTVTTASPHWDPGGGPVWNNDGDLVLLMDESGRVVDAVRY